MASIHEYPVVVEWRGGREGAGTVRTERTAIGVPLSVPPEFHGPGEGTNPEELITEAIAACYTITFGIVAVNRKLPYLGIETRAVGKVEQNGASFVYTEVVITPVITLDVEATDAQVAMAEEMAHKADHYCIVTNAVRDKVKVIVEPRIKRG
ncbi:MAG: OsmC family protein [Fimbriimonadaceae bacterium]|nr:OsmC family protein [Fimbriimonadaceae bacterium]